MPTIPRGAPYFGVMAIFGIPAAHEDDALRAVRAAAEMGDRLADLNEEFE